MKLQVIIPATIDQYTVHLVDTQRIGHVKRDFLQIRKISAALILQIRHPANQGGVPLRTSPATRFCVKASPPRQRDHKRSQHHGTAPVPACIAPVKLRRRLKTCGHNHAACPVVRRCQEASFCIFCSLSRWMAVSPSPGLRLRRLRHAQRHQAMQIVKYSWLYLVTDGD